MRAPREILLVISVLAMWGCSPADDPSPKPVTWADPKMAPMLEAIAVVDRGAIGFTPLSHTEKILLEIGPQSSYDVMLHIYGSTHRTISFRKTASGYRWIGEQEVHYGPKIFVSVDGSLQETLAVEYQVEHVNGIPNNEVHILYSGEDKRLAGRSDLTLKDIKPILEEWKGTPIR